MQATIGKEFNFWSFIRFTLPTISTMIFLSLYTIIDGIFISRYVGSAALSATNIVYPVIYLILGISVMFATGGSATVARMMGEGKEEKARQIFTCITITIFLIGIFISIVGFLFKDSIIYTLGGNKELYTDCNAYLTVCLSFVPSSILKSYFDYFLVTAGKPKLGLFCGLIGGLINVCLDYYFIVELQMGVAGAALATYLGMLFTTLIGLFYFLSKKGVLHFTKPKLYKHLMLQVCTNGSSEFVTQSSSAITTYLFNIMMLKFIGADGVAAITIVLYAHYMLTSVFLGFASGMAPIVSYNYGSGNKPQLYRLVRYGYLLVLFFSVIVFLFSQLITPLLVSIFTDRSTSLFDVTVAGFRIYAIAFLFNGINVFCSGLFTALSNGRISAIISFLRSLVFFLIGIAILPHFFQVDGIWVVVPIAEFLTVIFSCYAFLKFRKEYGY